MVHDRKTLQKFFDLLGPERAARIRLVSADAAEWIGDCALDACANATLCLDPFHIVRWATQALDVVRRWTWNVLRKIDVHGQAAQLKGCRYALWKNPEDLTDRQQTKLAWIARHNRTLYRAYLLIRAAASGVPTPWRPGRGDAGRMAVLGAPVTHPSLRRALPPHQTAPGRDHRLAHPRPLQRIDRESVNTKIRLLTRIAYGFRSTDNRIALCLLDRGGHCPPLPDRTPAQ